MVQKNTNDEFKSLLKTANDEASEGGFQSLPDNAAYHMVLNDVQIADSKAGNRMVVNTFTVLVGELKGKTHKMFSVLSSKDSLKFLFIMWRKLGVDTDIIDSEEVLAAVCKALTEKQMQMIVSLLTNNKGRQYMNIVSLVDAGNSSTSTATPAAAQAAAASSEDPEEVIEEEAESEAEIGIGTKIKFKFQEKDMEGEVRMFRDANKKEVAGDSPNIDRIVVASGGKLYPIKSEAITGII